MKLINGDCIEVMKTLSDFSVDAIITDPPYGNTNCPWDSIIPLDKMWEQINRIIKLNGPVCIFGTEPFSSLLRTSNLKMFKYDWIWKKDKATNHLNCKKQPMRQIEIISVFYKKQCFYNPQLQKKNTKNIRPQATLKLQEKRKCDHYGKMNNRVERSVPIDMTYPNETLTFNRSSKSIEHKFHHPSQKPVELLEYLIKTYTLEGETVLDFTMGSGTTGVACKNLNRNFIGIEKDLKYFNITKERLSSMPNTLPI